MASTSPRVQRALYRFRAIILGFNHILIISLENALCPDIPSPDCILIELPPDWEYHEYVGRRERRIKNLTLSP